MKITTYKIHTEKEVSLMILHISDTHSVFENITLDTIKNRPVNIIAITGDLIDKRRPYSRETEKFLRMCVSIADTYMVFGNEECYLRDADIDSIKDTGVEILDDKWVAVSRNVRAVPMH